MGLRPTYKLVAQYLEAGMRKEDSEIIYDGLKKFDELGLIPHDRVLKRLGSIKHMPDKLYMILKTKFPTYGALQSNIRQFEKPSFRP